MTSWTANDAARQWIYLWWIGISCRIARQNPLMVSRKRSSPDNPENDKCAYHVHIKLELKEKVTEICKLLTLHLLDWSVYYTSFVSLVKKVCPPLDSPVAWMNILPSPQGVIIWNSHYQKTQSWARAGNGILPISEACNSKIIGYQFIEEQEKMMLQSVTTEQEQISNSLLQPIMWI